MNVLDPVAVAAREAREAPMNERIAAAVAAEQARLDAAGNKICLNDRTCFAEIPADAKLCPFCGRSQALATGGVASARTRHTVQIDLHVGSGRR